MLMNKAYPKIAIILVNYNGKSDTIECLSSLEKLSYSNYEIIIIDNGSKDDSVNTILGLYPHVALIETKKNLGFAEGNNVGIRYAIEKGAQYFLLLNNDTIVDPQMLTYFLISIKRKKDAGILGAKIYNYSKPNTIDHLGGLWNPKKAEFESLANNFIEDDQTYEKMQQVDYVCGCAFFITKQLIEKIGFLEPKFFLIWEETDYCYRAKRKGFKTYTCPKAKVWHKISSSFSGGKPQMHYFWWRNRLLWIERNLEFSEKKSLYFSPILMEIFKTIKLRWIKAIELKLLKFFHKDRDLSLKEQKLKRYQAGTRGILHYFLRKFGNGFINR